MAKHGNGAHPAPTRPLEGIRVLDFGRAAQVPYAAQVLGDFGADVIKIEARDGGIRGAPPALAGPGQPKLYQGRGDGLAYRLSLNRNKRSLIVDLKTETGKDVIRRLAKVSDVAMENFRPGVMDRLGLGYEALRQLNPRLIYLAGCGFGTTGPMAQRPGGDLPIQAMSGLAAITGDPEGPPALIGSHVADMNGAMYVVAGVLLALLARERGGTGQRVDVNLLESTFALQSIELMAYWLAGSNPARVPQGHSEFSANYYLYQCQDGRWVSVCALDWERFLAILDCADIIGDPRYDTNIKRVACREELATRFAPIFRTKTSQEWLRQFIEEDWQCAPVLGYQEVSREPQVLHNQSWARGPHPDLGEVTMVNIPIHLERTPGRIERAAPTMGQHTEELLKLAGYSKDEQKALRAQGVV